jgi:hypothetical protein
MEQEENIDIKPRVNSSGFFTVRYSVIYVAFSTANSSAI